MNTPPPTAALPSSFALVDATGVAILAVIVLCLALALGLNILVRRRYAAIASDLRAHTERGATLRTTVLVRIVEHVVAARARTSAELGAQAIVEHHFQSDLAGVLAAERFVKSASGLVIILGLVGTFYGLTSSIGQLVALVSDSGSAGTDVAQALTHGLTQALAGMSVAFTTSLFGIVAAIVLTVVGVVSSLPDRRMALIVEIETSLDDGALAPAAESAARGAPTLVDVVTIARLEAATASFGSSVAHLDNVVATFDGALSRFAGSTRDFQEINHHLKDNIQRMSVAFADVSDSLAASLDDARARKRD